MFLGKYPRGEKKKCIPEGKKKIKKSLVITLVYLSSVYLCFPTLPSDYFHDDLCITHFLSLETKYHDDMCRFHLITGLINM